MRRVLVTGGNRGIGLELARQFVERGDRVIATARRPAQANELAKIAVAHPGRLTILPLDAQDPRSIAELAREAALVVDALDVLVNNAGVLVSGEKLGELDAKAFADTFATNVIGPVLVTQALLPMLEKGDRPRVVNLSSTLGSIASTTRWGTPSYAVSKAALNMATKQLSFPLAERGILIAAVSPGWVKTDMGGANAELDVAASARDLVAFTDGLDVDHTGGLYERTGEPIPF